MTVEEVIDRFGKYCRREDVSGLAYHVFYDWMFRPENAKSDVFTFVVKDCGGIAKFWNDHMLIKAADRLFEMKGESDEATDYAANDLVSGL